MSLATMIKGWVRPPDAPRDELLAQRTAALETHELAKATLADCVQAFDEAGSSAALKALTAAKEAEAHALAHVDRSQRLLDAMEAREAAEIRKSLEDERATLRAELAREREAEASLVDAEVAAIEALVDARMARHAFAVAQHQKESRVATLSRELGEEVPQRTYEPPTVSFVIPAQRVDALIVAETDPIRREMLRGAVPDRRAYRADAPRLWSGPQPTPNPTLGDDKPVPQRVFEATSRPHRIG